MLSLWVGRSGRSPWDLRWDRVEVVVGRGVVWEPFTYVFVFNSKVNVWGRVGTIFNTRLSVFVSVIMMGFIGTFCLLLILSKYFSGVRWPYNRFVARGWTT